MRVLGLDPGSHHTGWGSVDCVGTNLRAIAWGRLSPSAGGDLAHRLLEIVSGLERVLAEQRPEVAAVERVFHGQNTRSLIVLAEARGALLATVARSGVPIVELAPTTIKSAVAGTGRAGKDQVGRMVKLLLGLGGRDIAADATDALAAAITAGQLSRIEPRSSR